MSGSGSEGGTGTAGRGHIVTCGAGIERGRIWVGEVFGSGMEAGSKRSYREVGVDGSESLTRIILCESGIGGRSKLLDYWVMKGGKYYRDAGVC